MAIETSKDKSIRLLQVHAVDVRHRGAGIGETDAMHAGQKPRLQRDGHEGSGRIRNGDLARTHSVYLHGERSCALRPAAEDQTAGTVRGHADLAELQSVRRTAAQLHDRDAARGPGNLLVISGLRLLRILQLLVVGQIGRLRLVGRPLDAPLGVKAEEPRTVRGDPDADLVRELAGIRPVDQIERGDRAAQLQIRRTDPELVLRLARVVEGDVARPADADSRQVSASTAATNILPFIVLFIPLPERFHHHVVDQDLAGLARQAERLPLVRGNRVLALAEPGLRGEVEHRPRL